MRGSVTIVGASDTKSVAVAAALSQRMQRTQQHGPWGSKLLFQTFIAFNRIPSVLKYTTKNGCLLLSLDLAGQ